MFSKPWFVKQGEAPYFDTYVARSQMQLCNCESTSSSGLVERLFGYFEQPFSKVHLRGPTGWPARMWHTSTLRLAGSAFVFGCVIPT